MRQMVQSHRGRLVEILKAEGITSPDILKAFLDVPRDSFIQAYYERQTGQDTWIRKGANNTEEWYQHIYSNRAFVTLIDAAGRTLSSSSQPEIMARMLTALDVRSGQKVLEIGTGTGYNAALLAYLVKDPSLITTIDIEPRITSLAQQALTSTKYDAITVLTRDGREGYTPNAPYDRIIATASTSTIPQSWKEQLAPGGIVIAILQPGIAMGGGVLQAIKQKNCLSGKLLYEANFMPLHDTQFEQQPSRIPHIDMSVPVIENFSFAPHLFDPNVIWTPNFQFFLYATCPTLNIVEQQRDSSDTIYTLFFDEEHTGNYVSFFI